MDNVILSVSNTAPRKLPDLMPLLYPRQPVTACPACRGYDLERQWCEVCDHTGIVTQK